VVLDLADTSGNYLIVEANLVDDGSLQWIRLTKSSSYYAVNQGDPVSDARVIVSGGGKEFLFLEHDEDSLKGFYSNTRISSSFENTNYTLTVELDGDVYYAESEIKPVPIIDSVTVKLNPFSELGFSPETLWDIYAHFEELTGTDDHYLFNLYVNRRLRSMRPNEKAPVSDLNLEEYVSWSAFSVDENDIEPGDTITLEIRSISKENFEFYNAFFFQTDLSGNPFAGAPPANIPTNLSEGARGFFQVSRIKRNSTFFNPD
jgi:hypothetical protein